MNEAQAFLVLPICIGCTDNVQLRAMQSERRSRGISLWPELVKYLLSAKMTPIAMREAINNIQTVKHILAKDKVEFRAGMNDAA